MKKIVIILSILTLIVGGCGQARGKQAEDNFPVAEKESSVDEHYVTESDWKGVKCKKYEKDGDYTIIQECVFPHANLHQVYDIVKKKVSDMKAELPANNLKYGDFDNGNVIVTYTYKGPKYLHVELSYRGGETTVEIVEKKNKTQSQIVYSAD